MRSFMMVLALCASVLGQTVSFPVGEVITNPNLFAFPNVTAFPDTISPTWPDFERPPQIIFDFPVMRWDVANNQFRFDLYWDMAKVDSIGIPALNQNVYQPNIFIFHPNHGTSHFFLLIKLGPPPPIVMASVAGLLLGPWIGADTPLIEFRVGNAPTSPTCPMNWRTTVGFPVCVGGLWGDVMHSIQIGGYPAGFVAAAASYPMTAQLFAAIPNGLQDHCGFLTEPVDL